MDWIDLPQDRHKCLAIVKTAVHIRIPKEAANFMTNEGTPPPPKRLGCRKDCAIFFDHPGLCVPGNSYISILTPFTYALVRKLE